MPVGRFDILRSSKFFDLVEVNQLVTIPALLSPLVSPIFGSFITTYFSWIWLLWVHRYYILATLYFTNFRLENLAKFDGLGFLLFSGALAFLLYGLDCICSFDISYSGPALYLLGSIIMGVLFMLYNRKRQKPIIDFSIFDKPKFKHTVAGSVLIRIGFSALPFLLPTLMQSCFSLTPLRAALLILPLTGGALLTKFIAAHLLERFGYQRCLYHGGMALAFCMLLLTTITGESPLVWNAIIMFFAGAFGSLLLSCTNYLAYYDFQASRLNHASSLMHTAMHVATSFGIALSVLIVQLFSKAHAIDVTQNISPTFLHWALALMSLFPLAGAQIFSRIPLASPTRKSFMFKH